MDKWQPRILITYALLQIPDLALVILTLMILRSFVDLSLRHAAIVIGIWVLKDIVLFPFVWRAFDWHHSGDVHVLVGAEGVVEERLDPAGYIRVHGELWRAETIRKGAPVERGEIVSIRGMHGLVLIVE